MAYFRTARDMIRLPLALLSLVVLAACAAPKDAQVGAYGIYDPFEAQNRKVHAFNRSLDRSVVRPAGRSYAAIVPDPIEDSVSRFADNLSEPGNTVNALLQGNIKGAGQSAGRFVTNTVFGLGGLFDAASSFGIPDTDTDFGETLMVWGVGEGAYVELPLLGPSTQRDAAGRAVDFFTNPLSYHLPDPERNYTTAARVGALLSSRGRYSDTIDSVLYGSADSYAQSRLIYLQNRRFALGGAGAASADDPYADPYEDPYAQ